MFSARVLCDVSVSIYLYQMPLPNVGMLQQTRQRTYVGFKNQGLVKKSYVLKLLTDLIIIANGPRW